MYRIKFSATIDTDDTIVFEGSGGKYGELSRTVYSRNDAIDLVEEFMEGYDKSKCGMNITIVAGVVTICFGLPGNETRIISSSSKGFDDIALNTIRKILKN